MSLDRKQFKDLIERVLTETDPDLCSRAAVNLLLGTAAQESRFGSYLKQRGGGPALGAFQVEPATFEWLRDKYKVRYPDMLQRWERTPGKKKGSEPTFIQVDRQAEELEWDLELGIFVARLRYWVVPVALPDAKDVNALANYYKMYYNTIHGKATVKEFIKNYRQFVEASSI